MKLLCIASATCGLLLSGATALAGTTAGQYLMVVDSGQDRVMLFDSFNGSLVQETFIDLSVLDAGTPKHALQVGNEIWVTDQIRDRIDRFDIAGNYLSTIGGQVPGGGLDNIRGMGIVNGEVYVANAGTNNGAPGNSIVRVGMNGDILGSFGVSDSPWTPLAWDDNFLLSFSGSGSRIGEFDLNGNEVNVFHQGSANFIQQINYNSSTGGIYAAAFSGLSTRGIYEYDADGNQVNFWNVGAARGVHELGNGMIMWADGAGVDVLDPETGATQSVFTDGSFQYISMLVIPGPGGLFVLAVAGMFSPGRRRR